MSKPFKIIDIGHSGFTIDEAIAQWLPHVLVSNLNVENSFIIKESGGGLVIDGIASIKEYCKGIIKVW